MRSRPVPQIGFNFDYLMFIFTRISGLALFLLAFIGIAAAFYMGARTQMDIGALARWTFFPNPNHVTNTNIPDVTQGWANAWWQIMEMVILFFGASHGMNGLRMVLEDYIGNSWGRVFLRGTIFLVWLFVLIVGVYVILAY
jgi:succinate dehydrogenase hydrophobic anchor subunit